MFWGFNLRFIVLIALGNLFGAVCLMADEDTYYKIGSRSAPAQFLTENEGAIDLGSGEGNTALWRLVEASSGFYRIENKSTGHVLSVQAGTNQIQLSSDSEGDDALWSFDTINDPWRSVKNKANERYLNISQQSGRPECDSSATPDDKNNLPSQWSLTQINGHKLLPLYSRNKVYVVSPPYCSEVTGDVPLTLHAPGFKSVEVKCWKQGDRYGAEATIGTASLDDQGNGSLVFPADDFPHGPITLRAIGAGGSEGVTDTCYLQLYNRGGVSWNEGIPPQAPPGAAGMDLLFSDDFDNPLSISSTGEGATYYSHKPGGGDFGMLRFADRESPENPFSQIDSYLRIRADAAKGTDGLISSLRQNGTGIVAQAPCYFECRFLAPNAPGAWPAFWIMTQDTSKGLDTPADELDIIEGYGGDGPHNPNSKGYHATSHYWNQGPELEKQPGIANEIDMTALGGKSLGWQTFHTYGVQITQSNTVYYCDNIEVGRHPTAQLSRREPFFFFINLAVGGNGWPVELSRYNGVIDMYVDWVRVYQGK